MYNPDFFKTFMDGLEDQILYGSNNCCTDTRNNSKEHQYIIRFVLDKKETEIKQIIQWAKSKKYARLKFIEGMISCIALFPIEFRNWETLEIIDIFRR